MYLITPLHKDVWGNEGMVPCIFNIVISSRIVVTFTHRPRCLQEMSPVLWTSGTFGTLEKTSLVAAGNQTPDSLIV